MNRLFRTPKNKRVFGGVCGGLAKHFRMDPVVWRLMFVITALFSFGIPSGLIYIVMWIMIPEEPKEKLF